MTALRRMIGLVLALGVIAGCDLDGESRDPSQSVVDGVPSMSLTVGGVAPAVTFAWPRVAGAKRYEVVVLDKAGRSAWSWTGRESSVTPPAYTPIPGHGTATVAAFDARGKPLALSDASKF